MDYPFDCVSDYSKDNQQIHCLLFRCTIGKKSFAFASIVLSDIK